MGPDPDDPESDLIHVTWTNFDIIYDILYIAEIPQLVPIEMRTTIEAVVSDDGGLTWSDPVGVSPTVSRGFGERDGGNAPGIFGTLRVVQGSQPVVAPDGTTYVAWMDSTDDRSQEGVGEIQVAKSVDGGENLEHPGRGLGLQRDRVPYPPQLLPLLGQLLPADRGRPER